MVRSIGKLLLLALPAALAGLAPSIGCGATQAKPDPAPVEKAVHAAANPGGSVDHALVREAEEWMVEQAKRRAGAGSSTTPASARLER